MRNKMLLGLGLTVAILVAVAGVLVSNKRPANGTAGNSTAEQHTELTTLSHSNAPQAGLLASSPASPESRASVLGPPTSTPPNSTPSTKPPPRVYEPGPGKYRTAQNPVARRVLALVGKDHEAENIWLSAINDPTLPADERKDLIEDLNEDGISNPSRPASSDLPLITSRIHLIEQLAPSAIDDVNAAAFKEAHKDLVNMYNRLTER